MAALLRALLVVFALFAPCEALVIGGRTAALAPRSALRNVRAQEAPPPPPKGKLGATIDQDGKSNVWVRVHGSARENARRPQLSCTWPHVCPHTRCALLMHCSLFCLATPPQTFQAVEPAMKVDKKDKGMMVYAPVVGVAALALLAIPLLPALFAANPDQV